MPHLEFSLNGKQHRFEIEKDRILVGRSSEADLCFDDEEMSRRHCVISRHDGKYFVQDCKSTNGTILNDQLLKPEWIVELHNEDELKIGDTFIVFCS